MSSFCLQSFSIFTDWNSVPIKQWFSIPGSNQSLAATILPAVSVNLTAPGASGKWSQTTQCPLCLACLTQNKAPGLSHSTAGLLSLPWGLWTHPAFCVDVAQPSHFSFRGLCFGYCHLGFLNTFICDLVLCVHTSWDSGSCMCACVLISSLFHSQKVFRCALVTEFGWTCNVQEFDKTQREYKASKFTVRSSKQRADSPHWNQTYF